ncbi:hypothetical protein TNIN_271651 [Trichonephila inaurata madagascariensis]|uniref:Receptor ligand binding region domain-containing protein n=1 Tax=Trichonephila inaurata madagascariensis TaxID=2747483 RepID=A0A8X6I565_9ARAC|nr:hypothetical protein TNIN_271651 [Trichonephila inaurata madagascariensis]
MTRQPYQPHASLDHPGFGDHLLHMSCGGAAATQDSSQSFPVQLHPREACIGPIETQCHLGITHFFQGAVPLAVDLVNEDPELLPFHNLRFIAYDAGDAESALPLKKMTQMREEGVVGFIGLDGSCEHEALLAAAWDMTMVSYVSISNLFLG